MDDSWYTLGQALGISHEELDRIRQGEANPFKCKAKMFKIWIREDPTATWDKIASALEEIDKSELATEVRNQYGIRGDTAPSSSGYSSAESSLSWNKVSDEVKKDGLKHAKLNVVREFHIKRSLVPVLTHAVFSCLFLFHPISFCPPLQTTVTPLDE